MAAVIPLADAHNSDNSPPESESELLPQYDTLPPAHRRVGRQSTGWRILDACIEFFHPATRAPPPRINKPLFPGTILTCQTWLSDKLSRFSSTPWLILTFFFVLWIVVTLIQVHFSIYAAEADGEAPEKLTCTASLWSASGCGLNGVYCAPFSNRTYTFRCPASCLQVVTLDKALVGQNIAYHERIVVGGQPNYRGDSWLCTAAEHAGVIDDVVGGCFNVHLTGSVASYPSVSQNGISSLAFDSPFPLSYTISECQTERYCQDFSLASFFVSFIFAIMLLFCRLSNTAFYFSLIILGYWTVVFFSFDAVRFDDRFFSDAFANFLPLVAVCYIVYEYIIKSTLPDVNSYSFDMLIFYLVPFFFAVNNVAWSSQFPDVTLTGSVFDDPATVVMLFIQILIIGFFAVYLAYYQRKLQRLPKLISGYGIFFVLFFMLPLALPLLTHLHHYMISLLLLPLSTEVQTRPALAVQSFFLGWFIQGVGRWSFASPLEVASQQQAGDIAGTSVPSWDGLNITGWKNDRYISWLYTLDDIDYRDITTTVADKAKIDAYSLRMNDVEIYRSTSASYNVSTAALFDVPSLVQNGNLTVPFYFRVAAVQNGRTLDYSKPLKVYLNGSVVFFNGTWVP
eukprot:GILJ01011836.1.p1 GENE.GILJ01011836.1~~GILJ01011836.1.p1  ORF type:complete len:624 (+),score=56.46 GILJ01011836.1:124-1995(+)